MRDKFFKIDFGFLLFCFIFLIISFAKKVPLLQKKGNQHKTRKNDINFEIKDLKDN